MQSHREPGRPRGWVIRGRAGSARAAALHSSRSAARRSSAHSAAGLATARLLGIAALFALVAPGASAQHRRGKEPDTELPPVVDPYTEGDAELMAAAGIVSYAPFPFAGAAHTGEAEEVVGRQLIWIETEHFRLGSTLGEYKLPGDKQEKRRVRDELAELAKVLPDVNAKARTLDPWLRAHLYARRLEQLYADFCTAFDLDETAFPESDDWEAAAPFLGRGPHLGMPEKYCVLLTEKQSGLARYTQRYLKLSADAPQRWNFWEQGALFYGASWDFLTGPYENDSALQVSVLYGVAQNLVDGFRFYGHERPLWVREGFGHAFARRVDERWSTFHQADDARYLDEKDQEWARKVRARVQHGVYPRCEELLGWHDVGDLDQNEQRMSWSRADFLLAREDSAALGRFLFALSEPRAHQPDPSLAREELEALEVAALQSAFGWSPEDFDREWVAYVLAEYPKR